MRQSRIVSQKEQDLNKHGDRGSFASGLAGAGGSSASTRVVNWFALRAWRQADENQTSNSDEAAGAVATAAKDEKPKVSMRGLFVYATPKEVWCMIGGLLAAAVAGLAMPVWLYLLAQSLETFNNIGKIIGAGGDVSILLDELYTLIYSFAILGAISLVSGFSYVSLWTYTGESQALRIREKFVKGAFRQERAWFDTRHGDPQELPTLAANALQRINSALGRIVADTFANVLSSAGCLAVSIALDPPLALFMICMLPIVLIAVLVISCFMRKQSGRALQEFATAGAFATEAVGGIKTVASLCAEKWAVNKYETYARDAQKYSVQSSFLAKAAVGVMGFLFYAMYTWAFIFGTEQAANTTEVQDSHWNPFHCMFNYCGITGSEVMVCVYGIILCAQFFTLMSPGIQAINLGRAAATEIFEAISRTPEIDGFTEEGDTMGDHYDGSVELRNVTFCYPSRPQNTIFHGFNLQVAPGSSVALVGPSGSGKSSIAKLLLRLYDPLAGDVLVQGVPLTSLNLKWWRSQIGLVAQEPTLLPGSLRENIACGKPAEQGPATDEEVFAAARASMADEFIRDLPDGYDTFYNGASIQLSGGQIQRIAIARALIRKPKVLLLDEATSALDAASERSVQEALARIRQTQKLTTITVAHRLSTIVDSDQIAVIADGAIQELGTHQELFEENGIYAQLCETQGITADASNLQPEEPRPSTAPAKHCAPQETAIIKEDAEYDVEVALPKEGVKSIEEEGDSEGEEEEVASLSRLWQYNKPELGYMLLGALGAIVVGMLPPLEGVLFGELTANFFTKGADEMRTDNLNLSLRFLILAVLALAGNMALGCGFSVSGFRLTRRLRVQVFEQIMRRSMGWFDFPEHSTGQLTSRLEEDAEAVSNVTGWQLGQRIQILSSLLTGIIIALIFAWQIGLIAIMCIPFIVGAGLMQAAFTKKSVVAAENGLSAATILERGLADLSLVQAYNLQEKVSSQYAQALKPDSDLKFRQGMMSGLAFGFTQCAVFSTFALLFYAGIELMLSGKVGFTDFFTALLSVMFAAFGVGQSDADFSARRRGLVAAARIFALLDEPLDEEDLYRHHGTQPSSVEGDVKFESLTFSYPSRPDAMIYYPSNKCPKGFSLTIPAKTSAAFTGRSGCGKSTALQLLMRFYRTNSGQVLLDGEDIQNVSTQWLRGNMGYVGQMPVLFAGSVLDNVRLGKPNATDAEVVEACKKANANEFVTRLSDGYNTDIGAGGSMLSGGQKQRLAIARAIIKDPKILVLDEATSALDNESEKVVQAALDDMQAKYPRTTLVVAHRLQTIKECDNIAVLDRGGVKEFGSHDDLLQEQGLYYNLWKKQGLKQD